MPKARSTRTVADVKKSLLAATKGARGQYDGTPHPAIQDAQKADRDALRKLSERLDAQETAVQVEGGEAKPEWSAPAPAPTQARSVASTVGKRGVGIPRRSEDKG